LLQTELFFHCSFRRKCGASICAHPKHCNIKWNIANKQVIKSYRFALLPCLSCTALHYHVLFHFHLPFLVVPTNVRVINCVASARLSSATCSFLLEITPLLPAVIPPWSLRHPSTTAMAKISVRLPSALRQLVSPNDSTVFCPTASGTCYVGEDGYVGCCSVLALPTTDNPSQIINLPPRSSCAPRTICYPYTHSSMPSCDLNTGACRAW